MPASSSTWQWVGGPGSADDPSDWTLVSGPGNASDLPQADDTIIEPDGTITLDLDAQLVGMTVEFGATADGPATLIFTGDGATTSTDANTLLTTAVPGTATAESSEIEAQGTVVNNGSIAAAGPAGSSLTLDISGATIGETTLSGDFVNAGQISVAAGNTLGISVASGATFANSGAIDVNGAAAITGSLTGSGTVSLGSGVAIDTAAGSGLTGLAVTAVPKLPIWQVFYFTVLCAPLWECPETWGIGGGSRLLSCAVVRGDGLGVAGCPSCGQVCPVWSGAEQDQRVATRQAGRVQLEQRAALCCRVSTADQSCAPGARPHRLRRPRRLRSGRDVHGNRALLEKGRRARKSAEVPAGLPTAHHARPWRRRSGGRRDRDPTVAGGRALTLGALDRAARSGGGRTNAALAALERDNLGGSG